MIKELVAYLERLPDRQAREEFSRRCGTSWNFMKQVARGFKPAGESLAIRIDIESDGEVPCERVRRDAAKLFAYLRGTKPRERVATRAAR